jgi:hypothetical protein
MYTDDKEGNFLLVMFCFFLSLSLCCVNMVVMKGEGGHSPLKKGWGGRVRAMPLYTQLVVWSGKPSHTFAGYALTLFTPLLLPPPFFLTLFNIANISFFTGS